MYPKDKFLDMLDTSIADGCKNRLFRTAKRSKEAKEAHEKLLHDMANALFARELIRSSAARLAKYVFAQRIMSWKDDVRVKIPTQLWVGYVVVACDIAWVSLSVSLLSGHACRIPTSCMCACSLILQWVTCSDLSRDDKTAKL